MVCSNFSSLAVHFTHSGKDRRFIKGQKDTLLSRGTNLSQEGRQSLKALFEANRRLNKAYLLKEMVNQVWEYAGEGLARRFFERWKSALRWQHLKPYEKLARMIEEHWDGIAAYCQEKNTVPLSFVEGITPSPLLPLGDVTGLQVIHTELSSRLGVAPIDDHLFQGSLQLGLPQPGKTRYPLPTRLVP